MKKIILIMLSGMILCSYNTKKPEPIIYKRPFVVISKIYISGKSDIVEYEMMDSNQERILTVDAMNKYSVFDTIR